MFYNRFGVMTKKQMVEFILDAKNGIALSRFGHGFDRITIKKSDEILNVSMLSGGEKIVVALATIIRSKSASFVYVYWV